MPPSVKITKEEIIETAVNIVRTQGASALNARSVAAVLDCSTQPVYSNFATMEELRQEVIAQAEALSIKYIEREAQRGEYPIYKASGMAYIRFAREEKELFKLLYMRDRRAESLPQTTELGNMMQAQVQANIGLNGEAASLFHLEMWTVVHGIATMLATDYLDLEQELISSMLTDFYHGLKMRSERE